MFLESSFFPFPSEVVIPPAGYLAHCGRMDLALVILFGVTGSLAGALFNYYLGLYLGRGFVRRYGRYFFFGEDRLCKVESFFKEHGEITTFVGRLLPGIRQYISFPPGFARMNIFKFSIYTVLGASIWVSILALLGFFIGREEALLKRHLSKATLFLILFSLVVVVVYVIFKRRGRDEGGHHIGCTR